MTNSILLGMDWIIFAAGLLMGFLVGWFMSKYKFTARTNGITYEELKEKYVLKEVLQNLQIQSDMYRDDLMDKEQEIRTLSKLSAAQEQSNINLEERLQNQKMEMEALQKRFTMEFENIASRLLEEKSQKFTLQNQQNLKDILSPLKEKIKNFEEGIERRLWEDGKDRISLKKEIEQLRDLNQQLSQDANNLVNALKGQSKTQGDWGEFRLELLLQKAGLSKGIHYSTQRSYKDEQGKQKRPDFIINLPNQKHLVIDSKVSLVAYEKYFTAEKDKKKEKLVRAHIESIRNHIRDLSKKNYQQLYQINSPDYLLMFIPLEPAFSLAIQESPQLFTDALEKNIVIVTTSTLLATMRTVSYIWKQEKQKHSVLEIARQSGLLYDKFVNFVEDLKSIGQRINMAQNAYADAMNKLVDSKKYGDTLIGRAERIKQLGARTTKSLPKDLLEIAEENNSTNND